MNEHLNMGQKHLSRGKRVSIFLIEVLDYILSYKRVTFGQFSSFSRCHKIIM